MRSSSAMETEESRTITTALRGCNGALSDQNFRFIIYIIYVTMISKREDGGVKDDGHRFARLANDIKT